MVLLFFSSMFCCFSHGDNHDFVVFLLEIIMVLLFFSSTFCCFSLRDNHGFVVFLFYILSFFS